MPRARKAMLNARVEADREARMHVMKLKISKKLETLSMLDATRYNPEEVLHDYNYEAMQVILCITANAATNNAKFGVTSALDS